MAKRTIKATAPNRAKATRVQVYANRGARILSAKRALAKAGREEARDVVARLEERGQVPNCLPFREWAEEVMPEENYRVALERIPTRVRTVVRRLINEDRGGLIEWKHYREPIVETLYGAWIRRCDKRG